MEFDILDRKFFEDLIIKRPYSARLWNLSIKFLKEKGYRTSLNHKGNLSKKQKEFLDKCHVQFNQPIYTDDTNDADMNEAEKAYITMEQNKFLFNRMYAKIVSFSTQHIGFREQELSIENDKVKLDNYSKTNWTSSSKTWAQSSNQSFEDFLLNSSYLNRTK